jgi:hypothetical protein
VAVAAVADVAAGVVDAEGAVAVEASRTCNRVIARDREIG